MHMRIRQLFGSLLGPRSHGQMETLFNSLRMRVSAPCEHTTTDNHSA